MEDEEISNFYTLNLLVMELKFMFDTFKKLKPFPSLNEISFQPQKHLKKLLLIWHRNRGKYSHQKMAQNSHP